MRVDLVERRFESCSRFPINLSNRRAQRLERFFQIFVLRVQVDLALRLLIELVDCSEVDRPQTLNSAVELVERLDPGRLGCVLGQTLTGLLDAGYDGTLVASDSDGKLVFTIQLGPFEDLWDAERAARTLDAAYGYSSSVRVLPREEP